MTETAILTDSQIINSPTLNFNGPDIFAYTIRDDAPVNRLATESLLQLIILSVNEAPVLANETCLLPSTHSSTTLMWMMTITAFSEPKNCLVSLEDRVIHYAPVADLSGVNVFSYPVTEESTPRAPVCNLRCDRECKPISITLRWH